MSTFYIGVDGGATKCKIRVEDENGCLVGEAISGPANIRLSVEQTWHSIHSGLLSILKPNHLSLNNADFYAVMGLAGCEVQDAYHAFLNTSHPFKNLTITTDAHIACIGAHEGKDGSIIITGTGVVGFQIENNHQTKIGGWGFPHDDEGGGAWLGLQAVRKTFYAVDNREAHSPLTKAILKHFSNDLISLVTWANQANSTAFATLAPLVIAMAAAEDPQAIELLKAAAQHVEVISDALYRSQVKKNMLPCAMIGSLSHHFYPFFSEQFKSRLSHAKNPPEVGAILLARA